MKILSPALRPRVAGFTLIELLTVISIIAILAAASFAGYGTIMDSVRRKDNMIMAKTIENSITQFYADYNRLPRAASGSEGADTDTTTEGGEGIVKVLLGKEGENDALQNPRNTNYIEGLRPAKPNKKAKAATAGASDKWVNGLVFEDDNYEIVDASGNYFRLRLDSNFDREVENPSMTEVAEGRPRLPKQVIVWSAGKDGKEENWEDNPKSWE